MKILKVKEIGMKGYADYIVEMPAERRVAFCSDYPDSRYNMVPLDLPLPPMIYVLRGPTSDNNQKVTCSMNACYGLEAEGEDDLFYLPLLNYYEQGTFSICSNLAFIPNHNDPISIEDILAGIISFGWATPMRYHCGGSKHAPAWKWLGYPEAIPGASVPKGVISHYNHYPYWPTLYKKWEEITLAQACEYPWTKIKMAQTVKAISR